MHLGSRPAHGGSSLRRKVQDHVLLPGHGVRHDLHRGVLSPAVCGPRQMQVHEVRHERHWLCRHHALLHRSGVIGRQRGRMKTDWNPVINCTFPETVWVSIYSVHTVVITWQLSIITVKIIPKLQGWVRERERVVWSTLEQGCSEHQWSISVPVVYL